MLTEFQKDLRTMTLNDALIKHGLTLKEAFNTLHAGTPRDYKQKNKGEKYIILNQSGNYAIQKWVNGKNQNFGTYNTLKDAQKIRSQCIKQGWIQQNINRYCEETGVKRSKTYLKARYS